MNERIKTVRKNANLNQTEFSDRIGSTRDKVASYETGRVVPADSILMLIAKEFGVSYVWLKTGEGPMDDPELENDLSQNLMNTYMSLPERLRMLVDALVKMDPEWYKKLDDAFEEIERRKEKRDAD